MSHKKSLTPIYNQRILFKKVLTIRLNKIWPLVFNRIKRKTIKTMFKVKNFRFSN
jgi:hypothetical protein